MTNGTGSQRAEKASAVEIKSEVVPPRPVPRGKMIPNNMMMKAAAAAAADSGAAPRIRMSGPQPPTDLKDFRTTKVPQDSKETKAQKVCVKPIPEERVEVFHRKGSKGVRAYLHGNDGKGKSEYKSPVAAQRPQALMRQHGSSSAHDREYSASGKTLRQRAGTRT